MSSVVQVVASVNMKERYLQCIPFYIEFWKRAFLDHETTFIPRVLLIAKSLPAELERYTQYIVLVSIDTLPTEFSSQMMRLVYPQDDRQTITMTSDIDMFPLDLRAFTQPIKRTLESTFVVMRDVLPPGEIAICYNLASPETWASVSHVQSKTEIRAELLKIFNLYTLVSPYSGERGGSGWSIDQRFLYDRVTTISPNITIRRFTDIETGHRRLDRVVHISFLKWLALIPVLSGRYSDYHAHLPISDHHRYIRCLQFVISLRWRILRSLG